MIPSTLNQARAAKTKLAEMVACVPELRGIGIAVVDGGFGLKVNLASETSFFIPPEVEGVPVVIEIVGRIGPL